MRPALAVALGAVIAWAGAGLAVEGGGGSALAQAAHRDLVADPVITTVYRAHDSRGLMVTSGGWTYCEQLRALARRTGYTLLCGRYYKDQYLGPGLRSRRHLDWGNA